MTDLVVKAAYATVATEDGQVFVGFVDARDEAYALFRQPVGGGPIWFEVNDEDFGATDAIAGAEIGSEGLVITLAPAKMGRFGYASRVAVRLKACEGVDDAVQALQKMGVAGL